MYSIQKKISLSLLIAFLSSPLYAGAIDTNGIQISPIVAGTNQGSVFRSTDNGGTWQSYVFDQDQGSQLNDILWVNNMFIGVGLGDEEDGVIYASPNGKDWAYIAGYIFGSFDRVYYLNNLYFALGDVGLVSSADAVNWQGVNIPNPSGYNTLFLNGLAYGKGQYVLTGFYENESQTKSKFKRISAHSFRSATDPTYMFTATSTDAINWTVTQQTPSYSDIIWDGTQFVAASFSGVIATSPDGVNWTTQYNSNGAQWLKSMVYVNGTYVVLGQTQAAPYPPVLLTSKDAKTWTNQSLPVPASFAIGELKYKNHAFVISGTDMGGNGAEILQSTDAIHWNVIFSQGSIGTYSIG